MKTQSSTKILFFILAIALLLRLLASMEGLPAVYNSTEQYLAKYTLKMAANRTIDPEFYIYPPFYQYILILLYTAYYFIGLAAGIFKDQYDFAIAFLLNPSWFYGLGRILSLMLSLYSVILIYNFVRRIYNPAVALLGAGITAFSYHLFLFNRYATHESLLVFFTIIAICKYYDILLSDRKPDIFWAAVATGLAIAAKYNAGLLIFGFFLVIYMRYKLSPAELIKAFGIVIIVFLLVNPAILTNPINFWKGFQIIVTQSHSGVISKQSIPYWWEIKEIISREMIIGIVFFAALIFAMFRRSRYDLVLLSIILPTLIYVGSWSKKGIDYILVCWPPLIILSCGFINNIWQRWQLSERIKYYSLLIILVPSFLYTVYASVLVVLPDTRKLASEWILQNRKPSEKVCYDKNGYDLYFFDIDRFTKYGPNAANLPEPVKIRLQQYKNLRQQVPMVQTIRYQSDLLSDSVALDYHKIQAAIYWKSLDEIKAEGARWLIVNHSDSDLYTLEQPNLMPAVLRRIKKMRLFYSQLETDYQPRIQFNPGIWRAGPLISIYFLNEPNPD